MARRHSGKSFMDFFPYIIGLAVIAIAAVIIIGPTGKTKEAIENVKGRDMSLSEVFDKMMKYKGDYLRNKELGEKGDSHAQELADKYYKDYKRYKARYESMAEDKPGERKRLEEKWARNQARMKHVQKQEVPSDDPIERNKKLLAKKYKDLKKLDATCGTGVLNCPDIPVWADSSKTQSAGGFSHEEWVKILDVVDSGGTKLYKVRRNTDKREGWIDAKYIKEIYTKEMLENLKLKKPKTDEE